MIIFLFTIFVVKLFESYHYFFLCFRQSFISNWMMSMSRSSSCQYCQYYQETNDISSTYTLKSFRMLKWHVKTTQQSTTWLKKIGKSFVIYLVILNTRYNLCYTFIFATISITLFICFLDFFNWRGGVKQIQELETNSR